MKDVMLQNGPTFLSDVVEYHFKILELLKMSIHGAPKMRGVFASLVSDLATGLKSPTLFDSRLTLATASGYKLITGSGFFRDEVQSYARAMLYRDENGVVQYLHLYGQVKNFSEARPYLYSEAEGYLMPGKPFGMSADMLATCKTCSNLSPDALIRLGVEVKHEPMSAPYQVKNFARLRPGETSFIDRPIS